MAELRDVIAYLLAFYPHQSELSNARVTKMVYLADWKHALDFGRQMTAIHWTFNHYGPYVPDVLTAVTSDPRSFRAQQATTAFGHQKTAFQLLETAPAPVLSSAEQATLDHVIASTQALTFEGFIRLVYSTYPVVRSERYSQLDLSALADEYRRLIPGEARREHAPAQPR